MLEVLAAVAILAIWYVVIAAMATDGLRKLGTSNRLLEASNIADAIIAKLEASTLDGSIPENLSEETEEGDFLVKVLVVPLGFGDEPEGKTSTTKIPDLATLLTKEMPGFARHIASINVSVEWEEGFSLQSVRRTTYAFDQVKAAESYLSPKAKEAAEKAELEEEDDEEEEEEDEF